MVLLNKDEIKELIPHREPFLLIDEIIALDPGKKCTALKRIEEGDFCVGGHFPDMPVVPGVLMVEMLAQTAAVCVGSMPENRGKTGLLAKIKKAKFRRKVIPGDVLTLAVDMVKVKSGVAVAKGAASAGDEKAATVELVFSFSDAGK